MKHFPVILLLILSTVILTGCAKQGMPSGGPKDVTPPKLLGSKPDNGTTGFTGNQFYIAFDEYVTVKDAENSIIVSPPMKEKPEYKTKGKGLLVKIKDTLQENTTYLFQFKGAIADYTEGNALQSLEYVFSTSGWLDSMTLSGTVTDALTTQPPEETVSVWLFSNPTDTLPSYSTRCDKSGKFSFNYIRPGNYHIVALQDEDKNLMVGPTEPVGFLDSTVSAILMEKTKAEDSTQHTADTTKPKEAKPLRLLLSTPVKKQQRITSSDFKGEGTIQIITMLPMKNPTLDAGATPLIWRLGSKGDTLTIWTLDAKCDSLQLVLSDSSGLQDTLRLRWRPLKKMPQPKSATITLNHKALPYYDTLKIVFKKPLDTLLCRKDSAVRVFYSKDSTVTYCNVTIDSSLLRLAVDYPFQQGGKYDIDIRKGIFTDIHGKTNDSLHTQITVTTAEDYGDLHLSFVCDSSADSFDVIVQLTDEKNKVLWERRTVSTEVVEFLHLTPAKYRVRAIVDDNGNGEWDPVDYESRRQPERVIFLDKTLEVRAKWEYNEKIDLRSKR